MNPTDHGRPGTLDEDPARTGPGRMGTALRYPQDFALSSTFRREIGARRFFPFGSARATPYCYPRDERGRPKRLPKKGALGQGCHP